jgi:hypothetical protein
MSEPTSLQEQLDAMGVQLAMTRDKVRRHILQVVIADVRLREVARLARSPEAAPLAQLVARLVRGDISADTAGAAISRDPALAGQAAAVTFAGAQTGDVSTGDVAGRDIINITITGPQR